MGWTSWLPSTLGPQSQGFGFGGSGRRSERTTRAGGWQSPAVEVFWGESCGNLEIPKWWQLNTFLEFSDSPKIGGFMIQFDGRIFFSSGLVQPPTRFLFLGSSFLPFFFWEDFDCLWLLCNILFWEGKRWNLILLVYLVKLWYKWTKFPQFLIRDRPCLRRRNGRRRPNSNASKATKCSFGEWGFKQNPQKKTTPPKKLG